MDITKLLILMLDEQAVKASSEKLEKAYQEKSLTLADKTINGEDTAREVRELGSIRDLLKLLKESEKYK